MPAKPCSYSYAVFRYTKDPKRDVSIPVGVALWSPEAEWVKTRLIRPTERVPKLNRTEDYPYIDLVARKMENWLTARRLPYQTEDAAPTSDSWWRHLQNVLIHKVRVSEPLSIDCVDPDAELDPLFTSIVNLSDTEEVTTRIDGLITKSLGDRLSKVLKRGALQGFAGKPVQVMRLFQGERANVIVEAVNLAVQDADKEADAMVGKLWRARTNGSPEKREFIAFVGYYSSPGGLNGEAFLKDWIEQKAQVETFDVIREKERLRQAVERALHQAGSSMLFDSQPN